MELCTRLPCRERVSWFWAVLGVLLLGSACADDTPTVRTYVGTVPDTAAFVAVVVDGSRAVAYVCDGIPGDTDGTVPSIQAWFAGPSDGRTIDLARPTGEHLQASTDGSALTGAVVLLDGRRRPLAGATVRGAAGLYRAETRAVEPRGVAGWIVAADGQQRGGGTVIESIGVTRLQLKQPTFTFPGSGQTVPALVVSKNVQGLVPSPLTAEDFGSVSKSSATTSTR